MKNVHKLKALIPVGFCLVFFFIHQPVLAADDKTLLDPSLKPDTSQEIPGLFKEVGVIQRKAMQKKGRFLFSTYCAFDFSDGPYSNYSFHGNPGYAVSDFFEAYLNFAPYYLVREREIVNRIQSLTLENGQRATVSVVRPKFQYGIDVLWAPMYGKDSFGLKSIVRSDTFLKFGVGMVQYTSDNGWKFTAGVGKTFFIAKFFGLRVTATAAYWQIIMDEIKSYRTMALVEAGPVIYF